jgi:hypothetical protein
METPTPPRVLRRAPTENGPACLALRHLPRVWVCSLPGFPSTSLRSLRSIPITGLPRYYGRSDSCPGGSSSRRARMNSVSVPGQVSLLHNTDLPIPLSPITRQSPNAALARYPSARWMPRSSGSRLHHWLAGSPILTGRIEFVILRMDRSPPAALHPVSRRRSCIRLQAGERMPGEDFHLSDQRACRRTSPALQCRDCRAPPSQVP